MATRSIVPRATGEGGIGTALKKWATGFINALTVSSLTATVSIAAPKIADTTLSGTPVILTLLDQATGTPYYFKAYSTKL